MTIEQIKTLINGLKRPILDAIEQAQEAKDAASDALSISEQAQSAVHGKMDRLNPVGVGSFSMGRKEDTTIGEGSFAVGRRTEASGSYSHAEGTGTVASGDYSHAEGLESIASTNSSHAEGSHAQALGSMSHAEGNYSHAEGAESHAEGSHTKASGIGSHAEGSFTEANEQYSHAEGRKTIASGNYQHVEGVSNRPFGDAYLHITGNGDFDGTRRSNAYMLDVDGNAWFQGDVLVGSHSGTHRDEGAVRLAKINEVIPVPAKAEVGQTVVVSEVDEDGSPTAWSVVNNYSWSMTEITLEEAVASVYIPYEGTDIQEIRILMKPPEEWTASNSYFSLFNELSNTTVQHFMHLNTQVISTNGMWLESKFTDTSVVSSARIMGFYMWSSEQSSWNKWFNRTALKPYTGIRLANSSAGFPSGTYFKILVRGAI